MVSPDEKAAATTTRPGGPDRGAGIASLVRGFPSALGRLLVAPVTALGDIDAAERGGFSLLVGWCLVAAVALRFVNLADALVGLDAGGGLRVLSVLIAELTEAVPVALGASLVVIAGAGGKRDPAVDLELGCAATVPFMVGRAVFRAAVIVAGVEPPHRWRQASFVLAGLWAAAVVALAVRIARARPTSRRAAAEAEPRARAAPRLAGWAALGMLAIGLAGGVRWTAHNASRLGPVTRGAPAPDFTLPRIDGQPGSITLSSLRGRVVVLDFWATWCPPCLAMLPTMHELATELGPSGVAFVGVDSDGDRTPADEVSRFVAEHAIPYPIVYDQGQANELFRVSALPTLVVIAPDGSISRVLQGLTSKATIAKAIRAAGSPPP